MWDKVPESDKQATQENIYKTLGDLKCMQNFVPEKQVFFLDAKFAYESRKVDYITDDFSKLIDGLSQFIHGEQRRKRKNAYRLISYDLFS
jgi:hypothetical protein